MRPGVILGAALLVISLGACDEIKTRSVAISNDLVPVALEPLNDHNDIICIISPERHILSNAAQKIRDSAGKFCENFDVPAILYFTNEERNIVVEVKSCKPSEMYVVKDDGGKIVEAADSVCGRYRRLVINKYPISSGAASLSLEGQ